ncbi:MAG: AbrB/MazE/SpoVT family DNA-binding domain-containing protein [Thermoprotei archaeon]|nr:AbrB/MazE/SpoVT family DNA-binding domain-containing protein [Thermoprotei archaeon]
MPRVRVGRRGVIVIPKDVRERLGIEEGMTLGLEVKDDKIILRVRDLWSELRERGRGLRVDLEEAEEEVTEEEEEWLMRLKR